MTRRPFGGLMAGESAVFTAATAIFGAHDHGRRLADAFAESHAWAVPEKEILLNNGLADLRPVGNPTLGGRLTAAPDLHVDVAFFR